MEDEDVASICFNWANWSAQRGSGWKPSFPEFPDIWVLLSRFLLVLFLALVGAGLISVLSSEESFPLALGRAFSILRGFSKKF